MELKSDRDDELLLLISPNDLSSIFSSSLSGSSPSAFSCKFGLVSSDFKTCRLYLARAFWNHT